MLKPEIETLRSITHR